MSNESKPNPYKQSVHKPRKIHLNGFEWKKIEMNKRQQQ